MVNPSGRGVVPRRQGCCWSQPPPGDSPGGQLLVEVPWPEHGREAFTFRRSEIVAINLSYVRMVVLEKLERKKRNPGRLSLPGFWFVGRARRPSDEKSKSTQVASVALFTWPTRARKW
jgi:hypothetical protein